MSYKVDKGVPIPSGVAGDTVRERVAGMEIGDSIALPHSDKRAANLSANIRTAAGAAGLQYKFAQRKSETEMRVWRIA